MQRHRHQEFIRFLNAIEAQVPGYWKEWTPGRPAYFVPQGELHDPTSLRDVIHSGPQA